MNILIPYYSRTGHTEDLALALAAELRRRGHKVTLEKIEAARRPSKWRLTLPLLSTLPVLLPYLWIAPFRRWWLRRYPQAEHDIGPLKHPDVSAFDCICLGGPKWLYISYPIARYLQLASGLGGKRVGAFATFCGPPLEVFELQMLFEPLRHHIEKRRAELISTLAISSGFHEFFFFHEMEYLFRLISKLRFKRSLSSYSLDSEWGKNELRRFCDQLEQASP
jgi:hypothetical protein